MNIPEEILKLPTEEARRDAFAALPEAEQRRIAREYAHRVNKLGKPSSYNFYASHWLTPAVREELYVESRKIYSGELSRNELNYQTIIKDRSEFFSRSFCKAFSVCAPLAPPLPALNLISRRTALGQRVPSWAWRAPLPSELEDHAAVYSPPLP
jgi:hypothetical protein